MALLQILEQLQLRNSSPQLTENFLVYLHFLQYWVLESQSSRAGGRMSPSSQSTILPLNFTLSAFRFRHDWICITHWGYMNSSHMGFKKWAAYPGWSLDESVACAIEFNKRARSQVCVCVCMCMFYLRSCSHVVQSQYASSGLSICRQRFFFSVTYVQKYRDNFKSRCRKGVCSLKQQCREIPRD
jgi:hypothetical protein